MLLLYFCIVFFPVFRPLLKYFDVSFFPSDSRSFYQSIVEKIVNSRIEDDNNKVPKNFSLLITLYSSNNE